MAERRSFLLRIDGAVLDAMRAWAESDLRSLNGQIEFVLRDALRQRGRLRPPLPPPEPPSGDLLTPGNGPAE